MGEKSSDGEPFAQLNVMPTPHRFWWRDKTMEASNHSRFGLTCRVLTADLGEELLTLYLAGFHARTSAQPEKGPDLMESGLGSGAKCSESFAKFDPATSSWRTPQCSLFEDSTECLETLPRWGSMLGGALYPLKMPSGLLALRQSITSETDAGSSLKMPTIKASDASRADCPSERRRNAPSLVSAVRAPTPTVKGNHNRAGSSPKSGDGLATWAAKCPTPRTQGMCGGSGSWELLNKLTSPEEARAMGAGNGGTLNPSWVEWLMGWPIGWAGLGVLATVKYPSALPLLGESLEGGTDVDHTPRA